MWCLFILSSQRRGLHDLPLGPQCEDVEEGVTKPASDAWGQKAERGPRRIGRGPTLQCGGSRLTTNLPTAWRNGVCVRRREHTRPLKEILGERKFRKLVDTGKAEPDQMVTRKCWENDFEIPWFIEDRGYIGDLLG
jgi:hypothetical protein